MELNRFLFGKKKIFISIKSSFKTYFNASTALFLLLLMCSVLYRPKEWRGEIISNIRAPNHRKTWGQSTAILAKVDVDFQKWIAPLHTLHLVHSPKHCKCFRSHFRVYIRTRLWTEVEPSHKQSKSRYSSSS